MSERGFFGEMKAIFSRKGLKFRATLRKILKSSELQRFFLYFLSNFSRTWWFTMLKTFNWEKLVTREACVKK